MLLSAILIFISITTVIFAQIDSSKIEENKLLLNPSFHSVQIDVTTIGFLNQIGGQFDFDVLNSKNKNLFIGTRTSLEHYYILDFGGTIHGSPFTNYNMFARISSQKNYLSYSILGGVTYYKTNNPVYLPDRILFRAGFEIKLNDNVLGLVLKGSTSFIKNSSFIGIGISFSYDNNLYSR